mgnify:CR=1 FL=1
MLKHFHALILRAPAVVIVGCIIVTVFLGMQLPTLRWETDARVYMPKGHPAILFDEKAEHIFGAKDAVIVVIENDDTIFNAETLARIARVTEKIAALPGVVANRLIDVTSVSTASVFEGDDESIGARRLMPHVPTTLEEIAKLKRDVFSNPDLFVGNIVSPDGKAAMIRAKLKEGIDTRYQAYFQIKALISQETGDWSAMQTGWGGGDWGDKGGNDKASESGDSQAARAGADAAGNPTADAAPTQDWQKWQQGKSGDSTMGTAADGAVAEQIKDKFYLAGRPVVEVTSGMEAMKDLMVMVPLLLAIIAFALFLVFGTWRGVLLPIAVMAMGVIWTMGAMALVDVPMYTISTMLPVILVAIGIGDGIHVLSHYYDQVLKDPQRPAREIVGEVMSTLGSPLVVTSLTTAIGFLTLWFAEMPPFKVFGLFTVVGIAFCWLLTVTFIPATLALMRPRVGGYLKKRHSMRVRSEASWVAKQLVNLGDWLLANSTVALVLTAVVAVVATLGLTRLYVDSSWLSDFRKDSELVIANDFINDKFSGGIKLHVIVDGKNDGALKSLSVLQAIDDLQQHVEKLPYVGDSLSVVDYLKSMNKTMHAGDASYNTLPENDAQVAEYLFLFSISGRPDEMDEVVDFNYRQANITVMIKTDHTQALRVIIDDVKRYTAERFGTLDVDVNLAGSANNSYLWADMLIDSQTGSILFSKVAIAALAVLLFRSLWLGFLVVVPVTLTTLLIAGVSGFAGIPLDVSTALAAGVAIGVGVDYAVHYLYRYRTARDEHLSHADATRETLRTVGKTIVANAVVVTAGFAVLFFSRFPPHQKLGYFVAAYMVVSCLVALWLLPLALRVFPRPRAVEE